MFAEPQKEHEWLQQWLGKWRFESVCPDPAGEMPIKSSGEEVVRSLGGLWIIAEGVMEAEGGNPHKTLMTVGFDPKRNKYIGTWHGSMMTHLWLYEGTLDPTGNILPLNSVGPDFNGGDKMANYQDIFEVVSPDHRILRSQVQGEDGQWTQFMQADYHRIA